MIQVAAKCGLKPDEFWDMSLRDFDNYVTGSVEAKKQDYEVNRSLHFNSARWQSANIVGVWSSKSANKIQSYRFEWEKKERQKGPMNWKQMQTILNPISKPMAQA